MFLLANAVALVFFGMVPAFALSPQDKEENQGHESGFVELSPTMTSSCVKFSSGKFFTKIFNQINLVKKALRVFLAFLTKIFLVTFELVGFWRIGPTRYRLLRFG